MQILVTGSQGFIGKNLVTELLQSQSYKVDTFNRDDVTSSLEPKIIKADAIIHLAGENRPSDDEEFERGNHQLTRKICQVIEKVNKNIPIIFSSNFLSSPVLPIAIPGTATSFKYFFVWRSLVLI